jgi:hypothetical protein
MTGNPEGISSPVGLAPINPLLLTEPINARLVTQSGLNSPPSYDEAPFRDSLPSGDACETRANGVSTYESV